MSNFLAQLDSLTQDDVAPEQEVQEAMVTQDAGDVSMLEEVQAMQAMGMLEEPESAVDEFMRQKALESQKALDEEKVIEEFNAAPVKYVHGGKRYELILQGKCVDCAHCGLTLTDSESVERGLGPICSKKGYFEDPKEGSDPEQALIDLAEFPQLMQLVADKFKPQGIRPMVNFLVKICSLNRRSPVHIACTDAVESLGYKRLASTLRESVAVIEIKESKDIPDTYTVWVKKTEWSWGWTNELQQIPGVRKVYGVKGRVVPKSAKPKLWEMMIRYYAGYCATVPDGNGGKKTIRIQKKTKSPSQAASTST